MIPKPEANSGFWPAHQVHDALSAASVNGIKHRPAQTRRAVPDDLLFVTIYQLKLTLKDSKPPIWRRLQVRSDATLDQLHYTFQVAMGWTNSHLHQFAVGSVWFGDPYPEDGFDVIDERLVQLGQIVRRVKDKFVYEYDFGDRWQHETVVEKRLKPEANPLYPRCLAGKRHCPPEDVGGVWGYGHFLEAIGDTEHPEHADYLKWVGGSFDPVAFDLEDVNQRLKQLR